MLADLAALLFPLLVGLPLVLLLEIADSWIERLGLSFLLGVAVTALILTLLGGVGLPYHSWVLLALFGLWVATVGWLARAPGRKAFTGLRLPRMHGFVWLFLCLTVVNVATGAAYGYHTPISVNDVVVHWWPKAELLAHTRSLTAVGHAGITGHPPHSVFPDYPPAWPLHLFLVRAFSSDAMAVKLLPALYLISMLAVVFAYLRQRAGALAGAATVWVISSIPYIWFAYGLYDLMSEVPFMAFAVASTIMLALYLEGRRRSQLVALLILAAGVTLLRPEGLEHALILVGVLAVASWMGARDWRPALVGLGVVLLTDLGWQAYARLVLKAPATFQPDPGRLVAGFSPDALGAILRYGLHELLNPFVFGPTAIAGLCLLLGWQSRQAQALFVAVFLLDVAAMSFIYLILPATDISTSLTWWLVTGFKRMLLHFVPLLFIGAALAIAEPMRMAWLALPRLRKRPSVPQPERPRALPGNLAGIYVAISVGALAAAAATFRLTGPREIDLVQVIPNAVVNLQPVRYQADSLVLTPASPASATLAFSLQNLGWGGPPPNDTIFGRFTRIRAQVRVNDQTGGTAQLAVRADGRLLSQSQPITGNDAPVSLQAGIPPQASTLQLIVDPLGGNPVPGVWSQTRLHRDSLWLPVVLLLAGGGLIGIGLALAALGRWGQARRDLSLELGGGLLGGVLLVAALVQQLDVLTNSAVPLWYAGARAAVRFAHGV